VDWRGFSGFFGLVRAWQRVVLYGRPSARAKIGIQKPVQISTISALPDPESWTERGWYNIEGGGLVSRVFGGVK